VSALIVARAFGSIGYVQTGVPVLASMRAAYGTSGGWGSRAPTAKRDKYAFNAPIVDRQRSQR